MLKKFKQLNNFTSYYSYYDCTPVSTKGQGCSPRPASSKVSCPAPPVNPSPPGPGISSLLSPIPSSPGSAVSGKLMGWDGGVGPRGCHLLLLTGVGGQTDTHPRSPTSPLTPAPTFSPVLSLYKHTGSFTLPNLYAYCTLSFLSFHVRICFILQTSSPPGSPPSFPARSKEPTGTGGSLEAGLTPSWGKSCYERETSAEPQKCSVMVDFHSGLGTVCGLAQVGDHTASSTEWI
jgi:hypothetical protein